MVWTAEALNAAFEFCQTQLLPSFILGSECEGRCGSPCAHHCHRSSYHWVYRVLAVCCRGLFRRTNRLRPTCFTSATNSTLCFKSLGSLSLSGVMKTRLIILIA